MYLNIIECDIEVDSLADGFYYSISGKDYPMGNELLGKIIDFSFVDYAEFYSHQIDDMEKEIHRFVYYEILYTHSYEYISSHSLNNLYVFYKFRGIRVYFTDNQFSCAFCSIRNMLKSLVT